MSTTANDTGDQPILSVVVELYDEEGNLVNSATTDKNGFFEFAGVHAVKEVTPGGYVDVGDTAAIPTRSPWM